MKNRLQKLSVIITVLIICLSFCGCDVLDSLKENRLYYQTDGSILYGTTKFILLPETNNLSPSTDYNKDLIATDKADDIPVLLTPILGDHYYLSTDGGFILSVYLEQIYCREDIYDSITERIKEGFEPEVYRYTYYDYENEIEKRYVFSEPEKATFDKVLAEVTPSSAPKADIAWEYYLEIEFCSADMLFSYSDYEIALSNEKYYIVEAADGGDNLYLVPNDLKPVFDEIFKEKNAAEDYWNDF